MLYIYNALKKRIIAAFQRLRHWLWAVWLRYCHAIALYKSRSQLAALDDRELADIGISHAARDAECARRFGQDDAPWIGSSPVAVSASNMSAIDRPAPAHIRGRPATHIRSFYNERGRCPTAR